MSDDASATYRGYRRQALFALSRILTDANSDQRVYHPEGSEDLAIYDLNQCLIEVIQVKDFAGDLALSHFKPESSIGFFARMQLRCKTHPNCVTKLASFGAIGPELHDAIAGDAKARKRVTTKLHQANDKISIAEGEAFLDALRGHIIHPVELALHTAVLDAITPTIAGAHAESTIELLLFWVFDASEKRRALTRRLVLQQLERIGAYLAALRDHSAEWMVSVRPIIAEFIPMEERARLQEEYQRGVQARWKHILAGVDCPRPRRLAEVRAKLQRHPLVIIRGASGQGKSSLGWRYMNDYCPEGLRFEIRLVHGREHALRVAHALRAHVRQLRLEATVWLDLAPSDAGWLDLLRDLADAGIRVLVAVREEDLRRGALSADELNYGEVALDTVTVEEAEAIFAKLATAGSTAALDFADAWSRFGGATGGPLLEFTHLVTQGGTLVAKLDKQVRRLADEAASGAQPITSRHLTALSVAALAHSAGCRVDSARLCAVTGLDAETRPFSYLENEYLLRLSESGAIAGLHVLRSQAISAALLRDAPQRWPALATMCLDVILDADLEIFLLHAFSRRPDHAPELEVALLQLPLRSWTQAGAIGRSLLWEGVSRYERRNREALAGLLKQYEALWIYICDSFVAGGTAAWENTRRMLGEIANGELPRIELTPKAEVFAPFAAWIIGAVPPTVKPAATTDWLAIADLAFWAGTHGVNGPLRHELAALAPDALPADLKIDELAQLIEGFHVLDPVAFTFWHDRHSGDLKQIFLRETGSLHLEDDGTTIKAIFPVYLSGAESTSDGTGEKRALRLQCLLHSLFPQRTRLGTEGIGAAFLEGLLPFNPTVREMEASQLVLARVAVLNGAFSNLVNYRHRRLAGWREYTETTFALRTNVCEAFRGLHRGWGQMLAQTKIQARLIQELPGATLQRIQTLAERPLLPCVAVDEWGFISEDRDEQMQARPHVTAQGFAPLQRFTAWRKSFSDYATAVSAVGQLAVNETAIFAVAKGVDRKQPIDPDGGHALLNRLGNAWEALGAVQREFRGHFGAVIGAARLEELDRHEQASFRHLWAVAFWMVREPRRLVFNAALEGEQKIARQREQFLADLRGRVRAALTGPGFRDVRLASCTLDNERCLAVICDHQTTASLATGDERIVPALWHGAHAQRWTPFEWKPLAIEWPTLFVIHLLRGQALSASGVKHSLTTIFIRQEARPAAKHELFALPVPPVTLAEAGIPLNPSPLVAAALVWEGAMIIFGVTLSRLSAIFKVAGSYPVTQENLDAVLARLSRETSEVLSTARQSREQLTDLLKPLATAQPMASKAPSWIDDIKTLSAVHLLSADDVSGIQVGIDTFVTWIENLDARIARVHELAAQIVETYA